MGPTRVASAVLILALVVVSRLSAQAPFSIEGRRAVTKEDGPCADTTNRFVDCGNGTVTDTLTGLIWMANSACTGIPGSGSTNVTDWKTATNAVAALEDGFCGLTDGSDPGDWRLPTKTEWEVTVRYARDTLSCGGGALFPVWTNDAGTGCRNLALAGAFSGPFTENYWSSSVDAVLTAFADIGNLTTGTTTGYVAKFSNAWIWAVRGKCSSTSCSD